LNSVSIDQARHFDGAIIGQRANQAVVANITVDDRRLTTPNGVDDVRGIFVTSAHIDVFGIAIFFGLGRPLIDVFTTTLGVFIQRNVEFLDQVGPVALDEPRNIFGKML